MIHADTVAKTPSKDIIIAAGAGEICFCPKSCSTKAAPPDKIPAYNISNDSRIILSKLISSKIITNKKDNTATAKFCNKAIKKGKLNFVTNFPI